MNYRHGMHRSRTYSSWGSMKGRCFNQSDAKYKNYGGRGITVCERWMNFENFLADMGAAPADHTIERRDVNGNYEPGNCIWLPKAIQAQNKTTSVLVDVHGTRMCLAEACRHMGMNYRTVLSRINILGQTPEQALRLSQDCPVDRRRRAHT